MSSTQIQPPKIPTGQEVYDAIMGYIDPDLTTEGLKMLDQKYKGETPADFEARKKRYVLAYERYEQAYQGYMETLHAQVTRFHRDSVQKLELDDREQETDILQSLQAGILKFS